MNAPSMHREFYLVPKFTGGVAVYSTKLPEDLGFAGYYATLPDEATAKAYIDGGPKAEHINKADGVCYYVLDDHTLGYVSNRAPRLFGVLAGDLHGRHWINGPVWLDGVTDRL